MKATGIVRRVDKLGRIVLPVELRAILDINEKDPLEIFVDEHGIFLRKYDTIATEREVFEKFKALVSKNPDLNRPDVLQKISELGKLLEASKTS